MLALKRNYPVHVRLLLLLGARVCMFIVVAAPGITPLLCKCELDRWGLEIRRGCYIFSSVIVFDYAGRGCVCFDNGKSSLFCMSARKRKSHLVPIIPFIFQGPFKGKECVRVSRVILLFDRRCEEEICFTDWLNLSVCYLSNLLEIRKNFMCN